MEIGVLIDALARPDAYSHRVDAVEIHQTHISVVFLAGPFAYKVKKQVNFGFVDFSTLDRRRHYCEEEIRLNRRLAPEVYLGVVPVTRSGDRCVMEGTGEVVEWAVKMERLDEAETLKSLVTNPNLSDQALRRMIDLIVARLVAFYGLAERSAAIADAAGFEAVARNAEENFTSSEPLVGRTVSQAVIDRLRALSYLELTRLRPLLKSRADRGIPCDGHGDLRLDHIYVRPDRVAPDDLVIVDCIEFSNWLRSVDPVADLAFLAMDLLAVRGDRTGLITVIERYEDHSGDVEGRPLWPFFIAYRAIVRAKVDGLAALQPERSDEERAEAVQKAQGHWLRALGELEEPNRRPCLVLVAGPPGVGKSTLARGLADRSGFEVIRSDVVRKELAGLSPNQNATAGFGEGIYTSEWTEQTYAECLRRAEAKVFEGKRVVVDASFAREEYRLPFLKSARLLGVPGVFLELRASSMEVIRDRLARRTGDASDAGPEVGEQAFRSWEEPRNREVVARRVAITVREDSRGMLGEALVRLAIEYGLHCVTEEEQKWNDGLR
ncbi:bifunctional aminoglycoside phosphotransferase/ATP-binding protein [Tautonia rosea]|uniref:bifunctional aminoglycoside phosphotransferase/ATP-binding protein n=1 Tax=Tautonia rosea TaxID=2728037 RepID=UPI0014762569|nr:AAA family ATPase [Tautonia rosea]